MKKTNKKRRPFRHLNQFDRDRIEALLKSNHKQKEIAEILNVDPGTISKEIKRKRLRFKTPLEVFLKELNYSKNNINNFNTNKLSVALTC